MASLLRVLIIDDSSDDRDLLIRQLRRDGYDLSAERTETIDGLKAALDAQYWDIVLCDYAMPTFSGLDALATVQERRPDLPFIFVSGVMGEDVAVAAMKAGAQDYITKNSLKRLRSEEHTSELQSQSNLVCRLLLEKKKKKTTIIN